MLPKSYIVAGCHSWNRAVFEREIRQFDVTWYFLAQKEELTKELLEKISPEAIFFLHWSWKVPLEILDRYLCICFHMTDLPYGRGGTPLQNLILRGHQSTQLSMIKMTEEIDGGSIYYKRELSLEGSAEEIYERCSDLSADLIKLFLMEKPIPLPQEGEVYHFKRRLPHASEIKEIASLSKLYHQIRMVDAEGYPRAFFNHEGLRYEFSKASLNGDVLTALVKITPAKREET